MSDIMYSWNFHPLEVVYNENSMTNVVNIVHWQYIAKHVPSDTTIQNIGTVGLESPTPESFIPFENLTKEEITAWVEAKLGEEAISNMQTNLSSSLNSKVFPTRGTVSAPWSNPTGSTT